MIDFERTGNAAYLGRVLAELVDAGGKTVASNGGVLAVYKSIRRRLDLVPPASATGPFKVRFTMDTNATTSLRGARSPATRVVHEVEVR